MKFTKYCLFFLGLLLIISGFLVDKASNIPWVLSILSPEYVAAQSGLSRLDDLASLLPGDRGFEEIASTYAEDLRFNDTTKRVDWTVVDKIGPRKSQVSSISYLGPKTWIPLDFHLTNGQTLPYDLILLRQDVEGLKTADLSFWGGLLFWLGVLSYIIEFVVSQFENKRDAQRS